MQEAYLKASNSEEDDFFGTRVSLSGDRLAVVAQGEDSCADGVDPSGGQADNGCKNAGAVYLFEWDAATEAWAQTAYLKASNSERFDYFGSAASLVGDWLAVGAQGESSCADGVDPSGGQANNGCSSAGAVYLFERDAATEAWVQTAYFKANDSKRSSAFGDAVSLVGDRLAVGAQNDYGCTVGVDAIDTGGGQASNTCIYAGAVYLFVRDAATGAWSQQAYFKATNSEADDAFGASVSLWGDRMVVGAWGESSCADGVDPPGGQADNGCSSAGATYLFRLAP